MANEFASTANSSGLLKNVYSDEEPLEISLKKRREALLAGKGMADLDKQDPQTETKL
jgi:hypothetical protein